MRNVTLLFSLFVSLGLQAQSNDWFAPVGATWTYYDYTDAPPHYYSQRPYFQAKVVKDSVIFGKQCRKLQAFDADGSLSSESTVWLHIDSNRVYFLEEDTLLLFFDRGLTLGDTLISHMPKNYWEYDFTCCSWDTTIVRLDSMKVVEVDGESLNRWYFNEEYLTWVFTEKIGVAPFFGLGPICCLGGFWGEFHCYEDQTTFINTDTVDCTYPVGIESPETGSIQIAPNPTTDQIEIKLPTSFDLASSKALIYSLDGRLIRTSDLRSHATTLNLDLPTGLYLIRIHSGEKWFTKRLSAIR